MDGSARGVARSALRVRLPTRLRPRLETQLLSQATPVLLVCGVGLLLAGGLLDWLRGHSAFASLPALFILVPVLLGLKGNVELTLASRLASAWHLGQFHEPRGRRRLLLSNIAAVEVQAITVGVVAAVVALVARALSGDALTATQAWSLLATASLTAAVAGAGLAAFALVLVQASARRGLNPDNVGGPLVASVGDVVSLLLLALVATLLVSTDASAWLAGSLVVALLLLIPPAVILASRHPSTRKVLREGWTPILVALALTSIAGILLEGAIHTHAAVGFLILVPILNGVGGNIAGIHGSRTCTALHAGSVEEAATARRTLLFLTLPLHGSILLLAALLFAPFGWHSIGLMLLYLAVAILQVSLLLPAGGWLATRAWRLGRDPDNQVMPYLTALADVGGTGLLVLGLTLLPI